MTWEEKEGNKGVAKWAHRMDLTCMGSLPIAIAGRALGWGRGIGVGGRGVRASLAIVAAWHLAEVVKR
jgi:hypothetical protein